MGRKKIAIEKIQDSRLRIVTLNKRKKGLIKKAMEISLLTGVHLILTIFDKEEGKIIQYLSDSVEKFRVINQMQDIAVRKRYVKDNVNHADQDNQGEADAADIQDVDEHNPAFKKPPTQYINQKIQSEIYTNDHYDYLFNNGPLPDNMVVDSGTASAREDNDIMKEQESVMDSTGGPSNRKRTRISKRERKKKEKTSQNYRLKPPPKILNQMKKEQDDQNTQLDDSKYLSAVELGQNNLKQQLDFIQDVSNPLVKDQDPIDPEAPVEKEFARIQQIRKQERQKLKRKQQEMKKNQSKYNQGGMNQMQGDDEDDETSDEDIEQLDNDPIDKFDENKYENEPLRSIQNQQNNSNDNQQNYSHHTVPNPNQLPENSSSPKPNMLGNQDANMRSLNKFSLKFGSNQTFFNEDNTTQQNQKDDLLEVSNTLKQKKSVSHMALSEFGNNFDLQGQSQQQVERIDKMMSINDMNSHNYQLELNIPSDNSSNLRNISQMVSNEDVFKLIKQKNAEKRQERENQQTLNEKHKFKVPMQESKQLLSLQKQEISFNDRYAQYMSPLKNDKQHLNIEPPETVKSPVDDQVTKEDYQSSKSNHKAGGANQDISMDKFLLEDQEDISQEQKRLTKFYKQLKKKDLPYNEILLKIQQIRSGGKPNKERQNKQVGIDQFEKNLLQKMEEEHQKEKQKMIKLCKGYKQNKNNSSNTNSQSNLTSHANSDSSSHNSSESSNSNKHPNESSQLKRDKEKSKLMPQFKMNFDSTQNKQNYNVTNSRKDKTKRSEVKVSGKKRERQHSKDMLNINKQHSKKQRQESEYYQHQKDMQRHLKEGQKLYNMQILNQLQNNQFLGNPMFGSPMTPFNNSVFQQQNSKTGSKESDSTDLISSPFPKQHGHNQYQNLSSSKRHASNALSNIHHPLLNSSGNHANKYGSPNPLLMAQFNPYAYYPQQYLGLQAQFSGAQGYPMMNPHMLAATGHNFPMYSPLYQNYQMGDMNNNYGAQSNNSQAGHLSNLKARNTTDAFGLSRSVSKTNKSHSKLFQSQSQRANSKNNITNEAINHQQLDELKKLIMKQGTAKGSNSTQRLKSPRTQSIISLSKKDESCSQTSMIENPMISPKTNISSLKKQLQKHNNNYPGSGHQALHQGFVFDGKNISFNKASQQLGNKGEPPSESVSDNATVQNADKKDKQNTEISTSKFPSQKKSNSPEQILRGLGKHLGMQFQGMSQNTNEKNDACLKMQKGMAPDIINNTSSQRDSQKGHYRRRSDGQTVDKGQSQEALFMDRVRNMDQENIRKFRFLEKMNNDNNTIVNTNHVGFTGKNMMLSGQGFEFSMREAKILARKNLQNLSDQSQNVGYGSTFNHLSNQRNKRDQYQIDQMSAQSGLHNPQSKISPDRM